MELYGRTVWTQVAYVSRWLGVYRIVACRGTGFDDQDSEGRVGSGQTSGQDTTSRPAYIDVLEILRAMVPVRAHRLR